MKTGFDKIPDAIKFVNFFPANSSLRSLTTAIHEKTRSPAQEWLELVQALEKYTHHLDKFDIGEGVDTFGGSSQTAAPLSSALISLVATTFDTLRFIAVSTLRGYDIVDEDLKRMTVALPISEEFYLVDRTAPRQAKFSSQLQVLHIFAENCPYLSHLGLGFDAQSDKVLRPSESVNQGHYLWKLDISVSPMDDLELVASFLFDIFPNLVCLSYNNYVHDLDSEDNPNSTRRLWMDVSRLEKERREEMLQRIEFRE